MSSPLAAFLAGASCLALSAQQAEPPVIFKVDVVSKSAKAINYEKGTGSTRIDFVASSLMPGATGEAKVESKKGYIEVAARFERLPSPQKFGAEYLTYVLWSISPEGRVTNLGELVLKEGRGKLTVTTELQIFGLFITAEPYFAVRQPSDVIVLDNELRKDTRGKVYIIDSKLELLKRGQYEKLSNPLQLTVDTKNVPLELYEARNAVLIARSFGADKYAADTYGKAEASLMMAERYPRDEEYWNEVIRTSRQAVQIAEDARAIAVERQIQERLEKERAEAQRRQEEARQKAEEQTRLRAEADAKRAEAEAKQLAAEKDRVKAEQEKFRAEQEKLKAELEAARAATLKVEADAARAKAQQAAEEANKAREQAEAERKALRERLLRQFSQALPTRDSERGLVVNMGDVLFDTAKFDLRPIAREKLARLAGICLAYPGLRLEAEGHTDNTGAEDFNQKLSEQRAAAVREYLHSQGLPETSLSSKGLGMSSPVAPNNTSQGRQQNRRVELIVSGEVIGTAIGK